MSKNNYIKGTNKNVEIVSWFENKETNVSETNLMQMIFISKIQTGLTF